MLGMWSQIVDSFLGFSHSNLKQSLSNFYFIGNLPSNVVAVCFSTTKYVIHLTKTNYNIWNFVRSKFKINKT